jgi:hypothetical protein
MLSVPAFTKRNLFPFSMFFCYPCRTVHGFNQIGCLEQCKWDAWGSWGFLGVPGWVPGVSYGFLAVSERFYIRKHSQNLSKFDPNQARKSGQIHGNRWKSMEFLVPYVKSVSVPPFTGRLFLCYNLR